ncbi:MAG: DUF3990 domain-containing protein [Lachnospiraceae bacterium]|nr:DUF3990 domain-containing protein [Lachnospiraceae bacterium]
MIIYHGSPEIVKTPELKKGKKYNDYGQGFYCTKELEIAKEWAVTEGMDGYVNKYKIDVNKLKTLNLSDKKYSILHWLTLLVQNRELRSMMPIMRSAKDWLNANYSIDIAEYDVIVGYRADDSYFSFARDFLNNTISIEQLSYAMHLGKLGEQFVLKSEKAFENIEFAEVIPVKSVEYYPRRKERDEKARNAYLIEMEKNPLSGTFIQDLIRGEVKL